MKKVILILGGLCLASCANPHLTALPSKTPEGVRSVMGEPVSIVQENNHRMWTYRNGDCTQLVFFDETNTVTDWYDVGNCPQKE